ncbi:MAG: hypothetical protein QGF67_17740 [Lentisphaeria bacterium]|jgi:cytochrome c|nr:hypothetical protein [Lentisphaeria bacterium]MDP7743286.1 hypothetical protein [Lentisphaeria bacterium]
MPVTPPRAEPADPRNHNFKWALVSLVCVSVLTFGFVDLGLQARSHTVDQAATPAVAPPPRQAAPRLSAAQRLMKRSDCLSCHTLDNKIVGPSFRDIASRYQGTPGIVEVLAGKVKDGGSGNWGNVPMSPHAQFTDEELQTMVTWILEQAPAAPVSNDQP